MCKTKICCWEGFELPSLRSWCFIIWVQYITQLPPPPAPCSVPSSMEHLGQRVTSKKTLPLSWKKSEKCPTFGETTYDNLANFRCPKCQSWIHVQTELNQSTSPPDVPGAYWWNVNFVKKAINMNVDILSNPPNESLWKLQLVVCDFLQTFKILLDSTVSGWKEGLFTLIC